MALAIAILATGCSAASSGNVPSSQTSFDPSKGTPTDKVRWGGQFALSNGASTGPVDDQDAQARVIETFGKGSCSFYDKGGSVNDGITQNVNAGGLSQHDAIVFAAIAVTAYCPKHKSEFDDLMTANGIVLEETSWTPSDNEYGGPTSQGLAG